jgi:hypothetical protein
MLTYLGKFFANFFKANKNFLLTWSLIAVVTGLTIWLWPAPPSPVPSDIKSQLNFPVLYPKKFTVDNSSWKYNNDSKILTFTIKSGNYSVVLTEQKVPLEYRDDLAAYNRFIGSLRPISNFNSSLGTVSLVNFVTSGDYQPITGGAGILKTKDTLLIVHPSHSLSNDEWQALFNAMKIDN